MKVIALFKRIVNEILGLNLDRKRIFKFHLILSKGFEIFNYKIKMDNEIKDNEVFNNIYNKLHQKLFNQCNWLTNILIIL